MNSPESLTELFNLATSSSKDKAKSVQIAELIREVGLKCIGFNGVRRRARNRDSQLLNTWQVPRTINCLGAFRNSLPGDIISELNTRPTRLVLCSRTSFVASELTPMKCCQRIQYKKHLVPWPKPLEIHLRAIRNKTSRQTGGFTSRSSSVYHK